MKNIIIIITFLSFANLVYAQQFKLIEPNTIKLKTQNSLEGNTEIIYFYLMNNYKSTSKKYAIKHYDWDKTEVCSFHQDFEHQIKYTVFKCKEAGGVTIDLELPNIKRTELMNWIEKIYEVDKADEEAYMWKENNSKFEPRELIPGCSYKITEKETSTLIHVYCGC